MHGPEQAHNTLLLNATLSIPNGKAGHQIRARNKSSKCFPNKLQNPPKQNPHTHNHCRVELFIRLHHNCHCHEAWDGGAGSNPVFLRALLRSGDAE